MPREEGKGSYVLIVASENFTMFAASLAVGMCAVRRDNELQWVGTVNQ